MNGADDVVVIVVDGFPMKLVLVEFENVANIVVSLIDSHVLPLAFALRTNKLTRKVSLGLDVLGIKDGATWNFSGVVLVLFVGVGT